MEMTLNADGRFPHGMNTVDFFDVTTTSVLDPNTTINGTVRPPIDNLEALEADPLYRAAKTAWKVCGPLILLLGTVGNVMSLVVLYTWPKATVLGPIIVYMSALAVSDTLLLYSGLLRRCFQFIFDMDIRLQHDVICRLNVYCVYVTGMTSSWFLVAMTLQRTVRKVYSTHLNMMGMERRPKVVVALIVATLMVYNGHFFTAMSVLPDPKTSKMTCNYGVDDKGLEFYGKYVFPWMDMAMTAALPSAVLVVTNTRLAWSLHQSARRLDEHASRELRTSNESIRKRAFITRTLTFKLICLSVTFVCLTLPSLIPFVLPTFTEVGGDVHSLAQMELAYAVTQLLWYTNSAINFYLYCAVAKQFRTRLKQVLSRKI